VRGWRVRFLCISDGVGVRVAVVIVYSVGVVLVVFVGDAKRCLVIDPLDDFSTGGSGIWLVDFLKFVHAV